MSLIQKKSILLERPSLGIVDLGVMVMKEWVYTLQSSLTGTFPQFSDLYFDVYERGEPYTSAEDAIGILLYTLRMNFNRHVSFLINTLGTIVRGWKYSK